MNPLQNLKDIQTPAAIENWPPAYGWWLLMIVIMVLLFVVTKLLIKAHKTRLAKRQALKALKHIDTSHDDCAAQLNQLLKRVAISYFPTHNLQQKHGVKWTEFLVHALPKSKASQFAKSFELMQQSLYQPKPTSQDDATQFESTVQGWIKHALPPTKKTTLKLEQYNA